MSSKVILYLVLSSFILFGAAISFNKNFEIAKNIEIFVNVYKEINANYVDETNPATLMKTGIDAMLHQLDPFTNYITEVQIENYRIAIEGKYNGIGVRAKKIGDYVTITEVYKDYPAFKAGIKVGDQVIAINGLDGKGKESEDLFQIVRGMPKSEVEFTVMRPGIKEKLNLKLIRDEVNIPNVPYSAMVNDEIGYVVLSTFTENAGKNIRDAVKKLKADHSTLKSVILDLRDNGGGLLGEAVEVCNVFIPQGQLVASTRSKLKERDQQYKTQNVPFSAEMPLVVLINSKSASASEIVSGTIQDLDRGVIIGQISYGKGLVQNTKDVGYNAKVKLTIAKYYIPSGRCIQSVKYENGEPVHLPDSLRVAFKTRNGRTVYDGGGVRPDIELPDANYPEVVQKLIDQDMIFKYCTDYCLKNPAPADAKGFEFLGFEDFLSYLNKNNFDDHNVLETKLEELQKLSEKEIDKAIQESLNGIKSQLNQKQWFEINKHKELIINIIEEEIVSRSFYEEGSLQKRMTHDPTIAEAISILSKPDQYKKILTQGK
ncbi:MAG: S41 family peptidase [Saprospiraceae bacterium]|nr:S41 family peptidase [Saprospiraceae bacterium]MBK9729485.1 S41 family peptidase [Saprospiraceae bacterium]